MRLDHRILHALVTPHLDKQQSSAAPVALAICDSHGELLYFVRQPGVALHSGTLAQNKAYTAARDRQATRDLGHWSRESGRTLAYWSDPRFTGFAGGAAQRFSRCRFGNIQITVTKRRVKGGHRSLIIQANRDAVIQRGAIQRLHAGRKWQASRVSTQ